MFARTTRGQGRNNGGRLLRVDNVDNVDASRRKYFLGAVSVIYGPVICQFSSAGKHFFAFENVCLEHVRDNMDILFAVCGLTWISTEDYFFVIPYCDHR